ncbi:MAG: hypothetical protein AAB575_00525 [Patescibacteria group bacterium]
MHEKPIVESEKSFLDHWIETEFNEQYESQVRILHDLRLIEIFPGKDVMGIIGIDGKEYPVPTKQEIIDEIKRDPEKYETKMKQGFTKIQLTPFALPLERLTMTLERTLLDHYKRKKLFAFKKNSSDPDKQLELNKKEPLLVSAGWVDDEKPIGLHGSDVTGKCVYHIERFSETNHGGHTKAEILLAQTGLNAQATSLFAGWEIKLLQSPEIIPTASDSNVNGTMRPGLYTNPEHLLTILKSDQQCANEQGITNEDWLIQFLISLEQNNQVLDMMSVHYTRVACCIIGSYQPKIYCVGIGYWNEKENQTCLYSTDIVNKIFASEVRTAVPVGPELNYPT